MGLFSIFLSEWYLKDILYFQALKESNEGTFLWVPTSLLAWPAHLRNRSLFLSLYPAFSFAFLALDFATERRKKLIASTINTHGNSSQVILYFLWASHSFVVMEWLIFNAVFFFQLNLNSFFPSDLVSGPFQGINIAQLLHFTNLVEVLKVSFSLLLAFHMKWPIRTL